MIDPETYLHYIRTRTSRPSQGEWIPYDGPAVASILEDFKRLWATGFLDDLTIEVGKGSGVSSLKVGSGGSPSGIADLATMLVAKSKGADVVALMSIYANTGQTFYWLKSYGVNGPKDFPNHKIGNPPGDA